MPVLIRLDDAFKSHQRWVCQTTPSSSVVASRSSTRLMVRDANGHRLLKVSPSCKGVIRSLSNLEYKAGASVSDPKSDHSHMADAIGYASVSFAKGLLPWSVGQSGFHVV